MIRYLCILAVVAGCYRSAVPARFLDQPVVTAVDDARPIPEPSERPFYATYYLANALVFDPIVRVFDRPHRGPATNINALDEVPDSTWFTNRISGRAVTPAEAARGPDVDGTPVPPFEVVKAKKGGANPGFLMQDARGIRYLIKFDTAENPEQQTATNVIVNRIFWTLGYNVPGDYVFHFQRDQLTVPAEVAAKYGIEEATIDEMLVAAPRRADGAYRATASQFLDGIPKGGFPMTGVRDDDPNDRVPHEQRRELRALGVFAAWLGHTDIKEDNTLDMYVGEPGEGHLIHYLVDFGEAFGGHQSEKDQLQIGWEHLWDWKAQPLAFISLGLWTRPWECQEHTPWKSVGYFGATYFDPDGWHERYPYLPFIYLDDADAYWAAKLVMRFDRPMLEAIVATGQLTEPAAAAYLVDTLIARRDKIGAAYLDAATPFDRLSIQGGSVCGVDLGVAYGLEKAGSLVADGASYPISATGDVCAPLSAESGYHILRASIRRARHTTPEMQIHYIGGSSPRILGLVR